MPITPGQASSQVAALERSGQVSYITSLNLQAQLRGMARNPNIQLPDDFVQQRIVSYGQEHGSSEGGTYTSPSGQRISLKQAQSAGITDRPGAASEKLRAIGGAASTAQIEQRMGIEEARKRGEITNQEAIALTIQNIEGRPLQIVRKVQQEEQKRRADVESLQEFRSRTGALSPVGRGYREATQREAKKLAPERVFVTIGGKRVPFVSSEKAEQQRPITQLLRKAEQSIYDKNVELSNILKYDVPANIPKPIINFFDAIDKRAELSFQSKKPLNPFAMRNVAEAMYNIGKGAKKGLVEEPLTAGTSLLVGGALAKGAGVLAARVPLLTKGVSAGRVGGQVSALNIAGGAMAGYYGADVAKRIAAADNRNQEIGKILSTEIIPLALGAKLATAKLPELPYKLATGKPKGVLLEVKDMYATPGKYIDTEGLIVKPLGGIKPETTAFFTGKGSREGLTNIYIRPTRKQIPDVLSQYKGQTEYVSTKYGSYLKITPEGKAGNIETATKLLSGKEAKAPLSERIPIRIEKRLQIEPARIRLGKEEAELLGLPEYTYDIDVVNSILRGKGTMPSTPFGGRVRGAPERARIKGMKQYPQLAEGERPLFRMPKQAPRTSTEFKSLFDARQADLAASVKNILKTEGVRVSTKAAPRVKTTALPSYLKTSVGLATATAIRQQVKSGFLPKKEVAVAERLNDQVENLKKIFQQKQQPAQPTRQRVQIEKREAVKEMRFKSPAFAAYNLFNSNGVAPSKSQMPKDYNVPEGFFRVSPEPTPRGFTRPSQKPREQPTIKPQPKPRPTPRQEQAQRARQVSRAKTPRKPPEKKKVVLKPPTFEDQLGEFEKARKKRGKFVWNVRNQIPTLESLIG